MRLSGLIENYVYFVPRPLFTQDLIEGPREIEKTDAAPFWSGSQSAHIAKRVKHATQVWR